MPNYDWRSFQGRPLQDRFPDNLVGSRQWVDLVDDVLQDPAPDAEACRRALDAFMTALAPGSPLLPPQKDCCVFVSHRSDPVDQNHAEQIAWHATEHGYEYWLDVHNPNLTYLNGSTIPTPAKEILIAAVIEMALLNCSHLLAVITQKSFGSKWIPYEFGRAKLRLLVSGNSSVWLDNGIKAADCGEYVHLSPVNGSTREVEAWLLQGQKRPTCTSPRNIGWPGQPNPHPLPN